MRLTRQVVKIMQERTSDGYVFRTDLRLRPDPGATPPRRFGSGPLSSITRAWDRTWERAALIKARACAGDIKVGESFLDEIVPFIWRKYFDYCRAR